MFLLGFVCEMPAKPVGLAAEAEKSRLDGLKGLRKRLGVAIEADDGRQMAALARQLREVLREIDEIEKASGKKGSLVDELADRRKTRKPDAAGVAAAAGDRPNVGSRRR